MPPQAGSRVPVTLFAGRRGAGKSRTLLALVDRKPADERWTLIVEEIGNTMPEPGQLAARGVAVRGSPYGCPCCSGNLTMRVSLARAVRETRPQRLLIELPWGTHLDKARSVFQDPLLVGAVALDGLVVVLDEDAGSPQAGQGAQAVSDAPLQDALRFADAIMLSGIAPSHRLVADVRERYAGKRIVAGLADPELHRLLDPHEAG